MEQAESYQESLKEKCLIIAEMPYMYPKSSVLIPPVHICHHQRHLIIYTIHADHILIIRILHDRMDYEHQLQ